MLFEMLVGRMTFKEKTISDTLASVLKVEPDWSLLPADVPEAEDGIQLVENWFLDFGD